MWCVCVLTSFFSIVLFLFISHVHAFFFSMNFPHKFVIITVILDDDDEFQYFITIKRDAELVILMDINGTSNGIRWTSLFSNDISIFCNLNASNHWNDEVQTLFSLPVQIQRKNYTITIMMKSIHIKSTGFCNFIIDINCIEKKIRLDHIRFFYEVSSQKATEHRWTNLSFRKYEMMNLISLRLKLVFLPHRNLIEFRPQVYKFLKSN